MRYSDRFKKTFFNPTQEEREKREPLLKFSFYLSERVLILIQFADEIIDNLDQGGRHQIGAKGQSMDPNKFGRADSLMWLWILGAYEVARTIDQARNCFSEEFSKKIVSLKEELEVIRMPAAKMEKSRKRFGKAGVPVTSNRSGSGWDYDNKDLFVNDPEDSIISARKIIHEFDRVFCSMRAEDVLKQHGTR